MSGATRAGVETSRVRRKEKATKEDGTLRSPLLGQRCVTCPVRPPCESFGLFWRARGILIASFGSQEKGRDPKDCRSWSGKTSSKEAGNTMRLAEEVTKRLAEQDTKYLAAGEAKRLAAEEDERFAERRIGESVKRKGPGDR